MDPGNMKSKTKQAEDSEKYFKVKKENQNSYKWYDEDIGRM